MKKSDKLTPLDVAGIICFLGAAVMGFIWIQYFPASFLVLMGWLCLLISYIKVEKKK